MTRRQGWSSGKVLGRCWCQAMKYTVPNTSVGNTAVREKRQQSATKGDQGKCTKAQTAEKARESVKKRSLTKSLPPHGEKKQTVPMWGLPKWGK